VFLLSKPKTIAFISFSFRHVQDSIYFIVLIMSRKKKVEYALAEAAADKLGDVTVRRFWNLCALFRFRPWGRKTPKSFTESSSPLRSRVLALCGCDKCHSIYVLSMIVQVIVSFCCCTSLALGKMIPQVFCLGAKVILVTIGNNFLGSGQSQWPSLPSLYLDMERNGGYFKQILDVGSHPSRASKNKRRQYRHK